MLDNGKKRFKGYVDGLQIKVYTKILVYIISECYFLSVPEDKFATVDTP